MKECSIFERRATGTVMVIALAILLGITGGCKKRFPDAPPEPPHPINAATPIRQVRVFLPTWIAVSRTLTADALREVDGSAVPADWRVVVETPAYAAGRDLVRSHIRREASEIHVAWRFTPVEDLPLLPRLADEAARIARGEDGTDPSAVVE